MRINSRSEAKKFPQRSLRPCNDCQELRRKEEDKRVAANRAELEDRLAPHIARVQNKVICYADLTDDSVFILQAIEALIGPKLLAGTFSRRDRADLTPMGSDNFIDHLYGQELLVDDPTAAGADVYYLQDGKLWHKKAFTRYFLPPDTNMGRGEEAFSFLRDREFTDGEALTNLWLDYSAADAMHYLHYQCSKYGQVLSPEDIEKIEGAVRNGLRRYSVAQIWFIMWKVSKDAAALASLAYYSRERAAATIPNKIRKQLEIANQGNLPRNDWSRPKSHISGSLGMLFTAKFRLDEYSKGADALELFAGLNSVVREDVELSELAAKFIKVTLYGDNSLSVLKAFADMTRSGLSTENALWETINRHPALFE